MSGLYLNAEVRFVVESVRALEKSIDKETRKALLQAGRDVAAIARADHPWQNRSGDLEAATVGYSVLDGSFYDDTLEGGAVGATEYGSYLEQNPLWAFLAPAYEQGEGAVEQRFETALGAAIKAAGWDQ